jgi:hypothetical protein
MEYQNMPPIDIDENTDEDSDIEEEDVIDDAKIRKWCKIIAIGLAGALIVFIVWLFVTGEIYTMGLV